MNPPVNLPQTTSAHRPRKSSVARIIIASLILAVVGILTIPGYYLEERIRGKMAWEKYAAEARQRGVKLNMAEFVPQKIPDNENFASIPIFEAAFRAADHDQGAPNPFKLEKPKGGELPKINDPLRQIPIRLAVWQEYFVKVKILAAAGDDPAADVLKAVDTFAAPLAQLREASMRPHCRFPVHWEKGPAAALPQYSFFSDVNRLYVLRLAAHLAQGDSAAAYEDFRDSLRLLTAAREEPSAIAGMVRISTLAMVGNAVWGGLSAHQWKEPELRKMEGDIAAIDMLKDCVFCLSSERGATNGIVDIVLNDTRTFPRVASFGEGKKRETWPWLFYPTGWVYQDKVRTNQFIDDLLARIAPDQHRWLNERLITFSPENAKQSPETLRYAVFVAIASIYPEIERKYLQAATLTDQIRLACILERYRLVHGGYPETLDALSPEFIASVPREIVNGEPYHYRRTEDGSFILYSVGANLRDDGGLLDPKLNVGRQLDWVWRYPTK
jgi:hypothetical protein